MADEFDYDSILSEVAIDFDDKVQIVDRTPPAAVPPPVKTIPPTVSSNQSETALTDVGNLGRLAMFGNKPQVKRRSQLRREAEAAAKELANKSSEPAQINRPRAVTPRATPAPRTVTTPKVMSASRAIPTPRALHTPSNLPERASRDRVKYTGPITRSRAGVQNGPLLVPSQTEFVRGIKERERSCASVTRPASTSNRVGDRNGNLGTSLIKRSNSAAGYNRVPLVTTKRAASLTRPSPLPSTTRPPIPTMARPAPIVRPPQPRLPTKPSVRQPLVVRNSPATSVAFGSAVSKDVRIPYQERSRGMVRSTAQMTPTRAVKLRVYPGPSGTTPSMLPLTVSETPQLMKRGNKSASNGPQPQTPSVFERLARPTVRTPVAASRAIPIGATHGIRVPAVARRRDGSSSSVKREETQ